MRWGDKLADDEDCGCVILKQALGREAILSLANLGRIEALTIFCFGRAMVFLEVEITVAVSVGTGDIILVEEIWRKMEPGKIEYSVKDIEWIEYVTRGTRAEYGERRKTIESQRKLEQGSG